MLPGVVSVCRRIAIVTQRAERVHTPSLHVYVYFNFCIFLGVGRRVTRHASPVACRVSVATPTEGGALPADADAQNLADQSSDEGAASGELGRGLTLTRGV